MVQPFVSASNAWLCVVLSAFGVPILTFLAHLYRTNNHHVLGTTDDPDPARRLEIASTLSGAALIYLGFFFCCGSQAYLHYRSSRRQIAL